MDKAKAIELLQQEMQRINALRITLDLLKDREAKGYELSDSRKLHAVGDLLFYSNETLVGDYYKIKDGT
jgi:hypothetical protein